jgi:hypothetical protein
LIWIISVDLEDRHDRVGDASDASPGHSLTMRFVVRDTGTGIDGDSAKTLFPAFSFLDSGISRKPGAFSSARNAAACAARQTCAAAER